MLLIYYEVYYQFWDISYNPRPMLDGRDILRSELQSFTYTAPGEDEAMTIAPGWDVHPRLARCGLNNHVADSPNTTEVQPTGSRVLYVIVSGKCGVSSWLSSATAVPRRVTRRRPRTPAPRARSVPVPLRSLSPFPRAAPRRCLRIAARPSRGLLPQQHRLPRVSRRAHRPFHGPSHSATQASRLTSLPAPRARWGCRRVGSVPRCEGRHRDRAHARVYPTHPRWGSTRAAVTALAHPRSPPAPASHPRPQTFDLQATTPAAIVPNWATHVTGVHPEVHGMRNSWRTHKTRLSNIFTVVKSSGHKAGYTGAPWWGRMVRVHLPTFGGDNSFDNTNTQGPGRENDRSGLAWYSDKMRTKLAMDAMNSGDYRFFLAHFSSVYIEGTRTGRYGYGLSHARSKYDAVVTKTVGLLQRLVEVARDRDWAVVVSSDQGHVGAGGVGIYGGSDAELAKVPVWVYKYAGHLNPGGGWLNAALSETSLSYAPQILNTATTIAVGLTSTVAMAAADAVELTLTGFTGAARAALAQPMLSDPGVLFSAATSSWTLGTRKLRLVVGTDVPHRIAVGVSVLATAGIALPGDALTPNQGTLKIAFLDAGTTATASLDSIPAAAVQVSQAVAASLSGLSLLYSVNTLGTPSEIVIGFTNSAAMHPLDSVQITLPGFTGATKTATQITTLMVVDTGGWFSAAASSWTLGTSLLALEVDTPVPALQAVSVSLTSAVEIALPVHALITNQGGLTIAVSDNTPSAMPPNDVSTAVFESSPAVGVALSATSLSYSQQELNTATNVAVGFVNSIAMAADDAIHLVLAQFTGSTMESKCHTLFELGHDKLMLRTRLQKV